MRGALRIITPRTRTEIAREVMNVPDGFEVIIRAPSRSPDQNSKLWPMLSDVARTMPEGRQWNNDTWKCAFMHVLGHQVQFCEGLDESGPFPMGFRSSHLSKPQFADLITTIYEYGDRHGVRWSEPNPYERRSA